MQPPAVSTVLVAVDDSAAAETAVSMAVAIADRYAAELAVLYVHDAAAHPAITEDEGVAADRSEAAEAFLAEAVEQASNADVGVRTASAYGFSTRRKSVHPGSVVLDAADEFEADFLVIPRESIDPLPPHATLAKAAEYALLYASQPVLAV